METQEIEEWGEKLTQDVCQHWETWKNDYSFSKSGFAVFYSRPRLNPDLLILGFNPGGDENAFDLKRDSRLPDFHDYFQDGDGDYRLAQKMRGLFKDIDKEETLKNSVKLNLIFFRSTDKNQWNQINRPLRQEMEKYCLSKVREVIKVLNPKVILTEGIQTFQILHANLPQASPPQFESINGRRAMFAKSNFSGIPLLGIIHLSGARPSEEEMQSIKKILSKELQ